MLGWDFPPYYEAWQQIGCLLPSFLPMASRRQERFTHTQPRTYQLSLKAVLSFPVRQFTSIFPCFLFTKIV